jgi:3-carboxy-cis,cis-muconate cycloisomerase
MTPGRDLHALLFGDAGVAAELSGHATLQRMLDVEAALADAEASVGAIPRSCVAPIQTAANAELYDHAAIAAEAADAGNVAIPLVRQLTERVGSIDADAARYVHWGATSQDVIDTGLVLQLRAAVPVVLGHLERAARLAADHARRYADAPMPGRTWLQQATPITFGLKAAGWVDALDRARRRLAAALDEALVLQFGGASGTLASLGSRGLAVTDALATRLRLRVPDLPWHAHRDRFAQLGCALGVATGTVGKIARDLSLLAQTEIGEAFEAPVEGRGGSSTMPHKRNPVSAAVALAAAVRAPGLVATLIAAMNQEHERGLGGWQAEWDTLPELIVVAASGARALADALDGLVIDPSRMRANIDAAGGVALAEAIVMALAEPLGRDEAHARVEAAVRRATAERRSLRDVLGDDPMVTRHLDRSEIARRLSPDQYLGAAQAFVERVLARRAGKPADAATGRKKSDA